jgi:hypothetical protein
MADERRLAHKYKGRKEGFLIFNLAKGLWLIYLCYLALGHIFSVEKWYIKNKLSLKEFSPSL